MKFVIVFVCLIVAIAAAPQGGEADAEAERVAKCSAPADSGRCFALFPKFRYDKETKDCVSFVYGGCGGNGNKFDTVDECNKACKNV